MADTQPHDPMSNPLHGQKPEPRKLPVLALAEEVRAGDVFEFRGQSYLALCGITDQRHTLTHLVCVTGRSLSVVKGTIVLRLCRTFELRITGTVFVPLEVLDHEDGEVTPDMMKYAVEAANKGRLDVMTAD